MHAICLFISSCSLCHPATEDLHMIYQTKTTIHKTVFKWRKTHTPCFICSWHLSCPCPLDVMCKFLPSWCLQKHEMQTYFAVRRLVHVNKIHLLFIHLLFIHGLTLPLTKLIQTQAVRLFKALHHYIFTVFGLKEANYFWFLHHVTNGKLSWFNSQKQQSEIHYVKHQP